jgi:hypothetical protein
VCVNFFVVTPQCIIRTPIVSVCVKCIVGIPSGFVMKCEDIQCVSNVQCTVPWVCEMYCEDTQCVLVMYSEETQCV